MDHGVHFFRLWRVFVYFVTVVPFLIGLFFATASKNKRKCYVIITGNKYV